MANIRRILFFFCMLHLVFLPSPAGASVSIAILQNKLDLPKPKPVEEIINAPLKSAQKIAYLTFDDGPNRYTTQILNILQNTHAKATFFVIGGRVIRYPQTMKRIVREGHYLGLHSMSHNAKRLYSGDPSLLITEMDHARKIVLSVTGLDTHLVRVPYGSKPYLIDTYRNALVRSHFKLWDWTIDTYDWKPQSTTASVLQEINKQSGKDVEVILLHDSSLTVAALPRIIATLRAKGYTLLPYNPDSHKEVNFWHDARL
jgi:peptidoglycan/xylan/chitin deacetylase (PgdA/CDA1 family)